MECKSAKVENRVQPCLLSVLWSSSGVVAYRVGDQNIKAAQCLFALLHKLHTIGFDSLVLEHGDETSRQISMSEAELTPWMMNVLTLNSFSMEAARS
jgi:hypothetical protein